ncbi:MAG: zf-HC2 domain-containing protein [Cyanobacteria bacterium RUI128]|nr:zf-HC2 domain-containing protein [Cyanobacteria bacterium RUI128]
MKITCSQFEELFTFYINGELKDTLKDSFEGHLNTCPHCNMKFKVLRTIITDIREAYNKFIKDDTTIDAEPLESSEYVTGAELSAYIDNELSEENSIKIRRNIIAKPKVREKIEKLYKLRKMMSDSFVEHKNKMKTDFSKNIISELDENLFKKNAYLHCLGFVLFVTIILFASLWFVFHYA